MRNLRRLWCWIVHSLFWWRHDWLGDEKDCSRCDKWMGVE